MHYVFDGYDRVFCLSSLDPSNTCKLGSKGKTIQLQAF
jgi:hypothetical protein